MYWKLSNPMEERKPMRGGNHKNRVSYESASNVFWALNAIGSGAFNLQSHIYFGQEFNHTPQNRCGLSGLDWDGTAP